MNFNNAKEAGNFSTYMLYSESLASLNDFESIQKVRAAKYPTVVYLLEVEVPKGAVKKALFETLTIRVLFLNQMNILSVNRSKNPLPDMDSKVDRSEKRIFNLFRAHLFQCDRSEEKKGASAALPVSVREKFIDLVDEELDPPLLCIVLEAFGTRLCRNFKMQATSK